MKTRIYLPQKLTTLWAVSGIICFWSSLALAQPMTNTGYTIGSNLLGPTIVDGADHAGLNATDLRANDTGNGAGPYGWVAVWDDLWNVGDSVSLNGIAIPVRSPNTGTANNTSNGIWTLSIYELSGGSSLTGWDGTSNGEVLLATQELNFDDAGGGGQIIPYANFPDINFSAGSTGIAIHLDSTGSIRTRADSNVDGVDGSQFARGSGAQQGGADGAGHQWTIAGAITAAPTWNIASGGQWSNAANWTTNPNVPGVGGLSGGVANLGSSIGSPATVLLDTNVNLSALNFNSANSYTVSPAGGTFTLSGDAAIRPVQGTHQIDATITGSSGLTVAGDGTLVLTSSNTFSGGVDINSGTLSVAADNNLGSVSNDIDFQGGTLQVTGTSFTSLSRTVNMNGNGALDVDDAANSLNVTGSVTGPGQLTKTGEGSLRLSNAASFDGNINVNEGTLLVTNANSLGTATGSTTLAFQGGTVELDGSGGNLSLTEALVPTGRFGAQSDIHIRSTAGNNTITSDITAIDNDNSNSGESIRFENTAGGTTLTIDSTISHANANQFINYSFQGTGDFQIGSATPGTGKITGANASVLVALDDPTDTVTVSTAIADAADYWGRFTTVESGTLVVESDNTGIAGELFSSTIDVRTGATFDVSDFTTYNLQAGQSVSGGGTIQATGATFGIFDDNNLTPGDSIGTLTINGSATISSFDGGGTLNYELGDTPSTIGGTENDLIAISGALSASGTPQMTLNVTAAESKLGSSAPYRLISHSGGTINSSGITTQVLNTNGNPINIRQTLSVNGSTSGQVNLVVSGSEQTRTWTGNVNSAWDVNTTSNWAEGDNRFFDLDEVTFGQSGARTVTVETAVTPGSTTFNHTSGSYTVSGGGGIQGAGPVNVNSGTVNLLNAGNDYSGTTTVNSGATLNIASASTGAIVNNGTFSVGGTGALGPNFVTTALELNYDAAQDTPGDNRWNDQAPAAGIQSPVFANGAASPVPASDATFQYLTAAYDMSATNGVVSTGATQNAYFDARAQNSGTFEVVFNVSNTAAGTQQVLFETGATRGISLVLDGDTLKAGVNGDQTDGGGAQVTTGFTSGPLSTGWHHAVMVVNNPAGANDSFTLYVNNVVAGASPSNLAINDYAGGNQWGIGVNNSGALDPNDGTNQALGAPTAYHGQIALARYYQTALDSADVNQNYLALQDPTQVVGAATLNVDGDFTSTGTLELDVFADGTFDEILATGNAVLDGIIDVSLVGTGLTEGTSFTVLTALEGLTLNGTLNLPTDFSSSIVDGNSLVLTFSTGLQGDFNDDGIVDLADYTIWRNNLGAVEDGSVLAGNGNGGIVDSTDYTLWKDNYGAMAGSLKSNGAANVPEPASWVIIGLACLAGIGFRLRYQQVA